MESTKLKAHKHFTLVDKVVTMGGRVNNSETTGTEQVSMDGRWWSQVSPRWSGSFHISKGRWLRMISVVMWLGWRYQYEFMFNLI